MEIVLKFNVGNKVFGALDNFTRCYTGVVKQVDYKHKIYYICRDDGVPGATLDGLWACNTVVNPFPHVAADIKYGYLFRIRKVGNFTRMLSQAKQLVKNFLVESNL